jgi:hypothetical protein
MTNNKIWVSYKVGDELTLIRTQYKQNAYRDQFQIARPGSVLLESRTVIIYEVREMQGSYDASTGSLARDKEGHDYVCQFPYRVWWQTDPGMYWNNADRVDDVGPIVGADGQPAVIEGVSFCPGHGRHFTQRTGCFYCKHPKAWR